MPNKLTVLIDGGYLLMSRVFGTEKGFRIDNNPAQKAAAARDFKETMARTIVKILKQIPADNIILASEGGSWRKNLPIPESLGETTYKGHRTKHEETDWNAIYKAYNEFATSCKNVGITVSQHSMIEGDDWAWYWSRRLNAKGTNVIIWTSDADLKQLVQINGSVFTAWYNDKAGLVLPDSCKGSDDPIEYMINPPFSNDQLMKIQKTIKKVTYINPDMIVLNKVLCGDAGDNIKSIVRYKKNNRTYRFSEKDFAALINDLNISSIQNLLNNPDTTIRYIINAKKFAPYKFSYEQVAEMLDYNFKLVWLNESTIPDTVITAMAQEEYCLFNTADLINNHKLLLGNNSSIESIFAGIS